MLDVFVYLIIFLIGFVCGWLIHMAFRMNKCEGEVILYDDTMYLNITEKDLNHFKDNHFVTLWCKRRNFSPHNE